jgi:mono/diheme cytochrome c family protein
MNARKCWTAVAVFFAAAVVTAGSVAAWTVHHGFSARNEPTAVESALARAMRRMAVPASTRTAENPVPATEQVLSDAMAHFADHCAGCHGNDGRGETEIGRNLYPPVPNMATKTQELSDGEIFSVIKNGVRLSGMPAWGDDSSESDRESWALVRFIRHLPDITPDELERMRDLNPVPRAQLERERMIEEFLAGGESPRPISPGTAPGTGEEK